MPYEWVDPKVAVTHRGVTVWHVYRHDVAGDERTYWFTMSQTAVEDDLSTFDVRDLPTWKRNLNNYVTENSAILATLRDAIDDGDVDWRSYQEAAPLTVVPSDRLRAVLEIVYDALYLDADTGLHVNGLPVPDATVGAEILRVFEECDLAPRYIKS